LLPPSSLILEEYKSILLQDNDSIMKIALIDVITPAIKHGNQMYAMPAFLGTAKLCDKA
jgi:hypothetical protein